MRTSRLMAKEEIVNFVILLFGIKRLRRENVSKFNCVNNTFVADFLDINRQKKSYTRILVKKKL